MFTGGDNSPSVLSSSVARGLLSSGATVWVSVVMSVILYMKPCREKLKEVNWKVVTLIVLGKGIFWFRFRLFHPVFAGSFRVSLFIDLGFP